MSIFSIEQLVDDLTPVRRLNGWHAALAVAAMTALAIAVTAWRYGLRGDVMIGAPVPMVLVRASVLALLGTASLTAVIDSARPRVGRHSNGWSWMLGLALTFPLLTIALSISTATMPHAEMTATSAYWCLGISLSAALLIGTAITLWLRRGAVTVAGHTAWLVGLCAGAFGTFAYSLHCPSSTVAYIGIWYTAAVGTSAVAGRLILPPLLRW
ncbi:MAG: DUF1109 domain-containing protein [Pseudomonadota bacterium]